jgi:hypothetical protein
MLGVGRGANNSSPQKRILLQNVRSESLISVLIFWYECLAVSKEKCVTLAVHLAYSGRCQNTDMWVAFCWIVVSDSHLSFRDTSLYFLHLKYYNSGKPF